MTLDLHGIKSVLLGAERYAFWDASKFNARSVGEKHTMFESRVSLGYDCWDCSVSNIICHGNFNDNVPSVIAQRWTV